ncbi:MAG: glutamate 5-kinase [Micavibrio sp.]|nr:MAG: glutamate 5-kinase [Micavibrio sp.]
MNTSDALKNSKRIVIKIGSALLINETHEELNQEWIDSLAKKIHTLNKSGKEIVIVSSGAVAMGRKALGIPFDIAPGNIRLEQKQAASAVGQPLVFNGYQKAFEQLGMCVAQVLLTMSTTESRRMHLNARETLQALLNKNIIPVINENDTVLTQEIRFGDNDSLAVRVAQMMEADTVLLLSSTEGLHTADPNTNPDAEHISLVEEITDEYIKMAGDALPGPSTGGMKSKIEAAQAATRAGISLIIARELDGKCTLFKAQDNAPNARKRWIATHMKPKGSVTIDDGALKALQDGKSLLPIGVKSVEGSFERGDVIKVLGHNRNEVAMGISAYSSKDTSMIMGQKKEWVHTLQGYLGRDELIHRNDLVLF